MGILTSHRRYGRAHKCCWNDLARFCGETVVNSHVFSLASMHGVIAASQLTSAREEKAGIKYNKPTA